MKIVLTGVETNNKGAELMLYAILQEIERRHPDARVYLQPQAVMQGVDYIITTLDVRLWPLSVFVQNNHLNELLRKLHLPIIRDSRAVKADYLMDGSGFRFSDQCKLWGTTPGWWNRLLKKQKKNGAKIVFLPQAFGPFEMGMTRKALVAIGKHSSVIMSRELVSYNFVKETGLVDMKKVVTYPDFTSLVEGVFPSKYEHLRNGICIIPNMKMILKGNVSYSDYVNLLTRIIEEGDKSGHPVYLLNHEGVEDEKLAYQCRDSINSKIEVVTGINALEVKGLIATSYLVITSRFHGLASALNSCVPSLATSWSHKYEELYKDYSLTNYVLPLDDNEEAIKKVHELLEVEENRRIRNVLSEQVPLMKDKTREMWNLIWNL